MRTFTCTECKKTFGISHWTTNSKITGDVCQTCGIKFKDKLETTEAQCPRCRKMIPGYAPQGKGGYLICPHCGNNKPDEAVKEWECEVCGKKFDFSIQQWKHVRVPGGLVCPTCIKTLPVIDESKIYGFTKHDEQKIRMDLIPVSMQKALGVALTYGSIKYTDRNWEKGTEWSRYFGAMMRHLIAYWGGEDIDAESGLPHLWLASCCLSFLVEYQEADIGTDDRPKHKYKDRTEMIAASFEKAKELALGPA